MMKKPALTALTMVIAVGSIALLIVVFVVVAGVDLLQQGLYDTEYSETFLGADACSEKALSNLNTNHSYAGELALIIGDISCDIVVVVVDSDTRTIQVTATQGLVYVSRLEISVSNLNSPPITVTNWEEVSSF
ncbi:hypothetical protein HOD30_01515 [Candidatus Peregrinibacteria bacterium]|jgi:hypothetical protein|nr:hypothetical protein [Candidatus Peregrinibacteria bacterium]MBT4632218.1 hypothetical protein [Candidatus Peregrinibacteria bacterium]MBT5824371.1 hypothetical protein [Candidatus Peregrinibacteria bacterium]